MINLLPKNEKENLLFDRDKKMIMVLGYIIIIALMCLSLFLFSIKFYILGDVASQNVLLGITEKSYQNPDFLTFKDMIQKYNSDLVKINTFYSKEVYFSDLLKNILAIQRPNGVYFTDISMVKDQVSNTVKITIAGTSDTRDNLSIFRENLENNQKIENVYFPPENWIKPINLNFYLSFTIIPTKE